MTKSAAFGKPGSENELGGKLPSSFLLRRCGVETVKICLPLTARLLLADMAERRGENESELLARLVRREALREAAKAERRRKVAQDVV